jgi:2Fe-2S ferredoxin
MGEALPKVVFFGADGTQYSVDAAAGQSVMQAAVANGIPGILGECGGNLSCATCHVWVRSEFVAAVGGPVGIEDDLLDLAVDERRPGSRLGCQVVVTDDLDGLTVDVPPEER